MVLRPWTVERSKVLFSHPRIVVTEDAVRLPNGQIVEDYLRIAVAEHVVMIVRTDNGKFLLQRQYKHGPRAVVLTFPAGGIEPGEAPADAASRELQEETGFRARDWRYLGRFVLNGNQGSGAVHLLLVEGVEGAGRPVSAADADLEEQELEEQELEEQELLWLTEAELVEAAKGGQFRIASHALALAFAVNPRLWPDG